ncbi:TonB-dependent siderophore receptor [Caulobacter sp. D4A]|uniref:TonB-dependent siderophore receptor n=1 Tax=unclassified Caulobacter TaxID=2648921 RepID=UPI000D73B855|nr:MULTISPECIES: TonB-dependent siderophore receptor [unclassified Caulobacter]PXA95157.1 TonB-dependent siderophore receptor [Caulobacter sp. D4A]PXA96100.1 TonB-dependent siderophore receptor [Caulobacter sp. D5]
MSRSLRAFLLAAAMSPALLAAAHAAEAPAADGAADNLDGVVVTGAKTRTSAVTGLDMSLRETPQSVTIIDGATIHDFALTNINDVLALTTGVNVEKVETDRTYYNSRGFDITNFQVDGVGLPLIWGIQFGELDTVLFDRVEVVRGANSMMTGTGNPSATVNYVRKRPTAEFQASGALQYGSWDSKRLEADVSGPLNESGTLRGRLIYANEDRDSYLDHYKVNRNVYAALLAWDATPNTTATFGWSMQDNRASGVLWGALPLTYSDGSLINYDVSSSTSADWTYWDVRDQTAFAEVEHRLDNGWRLKAIATAKRFEEHAKLLYAYTGEDGIDPTTGLGVYGMSGVYPSIYESYTLDAYASGPFQAFGREHQLVVGGQVSRSEGHEYEDFSSDSIVYSSVTSWGSTQPAEPTYPGAYLAANETTKLARFYAGAHLSVTDKLKLVTGFNALKLKAYGFSYGADMARDESKVSPYLGAVYDLNKNVSLYASYTDIFNPQSEVDSTRAKLAAVHGKSYEAGVKSEWFDGRLYVTGSVFKAVQKGLAAWAGYFDDGKSYYSAQDTESKGYEIEASGRITDNWRIGAGWTSLEIEDTATGADARVFLPRKTLKASTTYSVPSLRNLKLGAAVRWQDEITTDAADVTQDAYAVVDLMAGVDVTDRIRGTLNLKNVGDEKYLNSLMWGQAYYAAPRSVSVRLDYRF